MSASCEMQASPSALSAVLGNTGARWCASFPTATQICCFWPPVENMYWPRILCHHRRHTAADVKQRPRSNCRQPCHSLQHKWSTDSEVARASAAQRNSARDVCVTGEHILYMSACGVQQQQHFFLKGRTHRDHLFLSADRSAAHDPIRRGGCRWGRPGWRTICSLAVQGWSG